MLHLLIYAAVGQAAPRPQEPERVQLYPVHCAVRRSAELRACWVGIPTGSLGGATYAALLWPVHAAVTCVVRPRGRCRQALLNLIYTVFECSGVHVHVHVHVVIVYGSHRYLMRTFIHKAPNGIAVPDDMGAAVRFVRIPTPPDAVRGSVTSCDGAKIDEKICHGLGTGLACSEGRPQRRAARALALSPDVCDEHAPPLAAANIIIPCAIAAAARAASCQPPTAVPAILMVEQVGHSNDWRTRWSRERSSSRC